MSKWLYVETLASPFEFFFRTKSRSEISTASLQTMVMNTVVDLLIVIVDDVLSRLDGSESDGSLAA